MPSINQVHPSGMTVLAEEGISITMFRKLALSPRRSVLSRFATARGTEVIGNVKASSRLTDLATRIPNACLSYTGKY